MQLYFLSCFCIYRLQVQLARVEAKTKPLEKSAKKNPLLDRVTAVVLAFSYGFKFLGRATFHRRNAAGAWENEKRERKTPQVRIKLWFFPCSAQARQLYVFKVFSWFMMSAPLACKISVPTASRLAARRVRLLKNLKNQFNRILTAPQRTICHWGLCVVALYCVSSAIYCCCFLLMFASIAWVEFIHESTLTPT